MHDVNIAYAYGVDMPAGASIGIAWANTRTPECVRSDGYRAAPGKTLTDAIRWAAGEWCREMDSTGRLDGMLFIEGACDPSKVTEKISGQYVIRGVSALSVQNDAHLLRHLARSAKRAAVRLPASVRATVNDAVASYGDGMPPCVQRRLQDAWPDMPPVDQAKVQDACFELEQAWQSDDIAAAYRNAMKLSSLLVALLPEQHGQSKEGEQHA